MSGSRIRRITAERSFDRYGDKTSPCASDKVEINRTHCLRTGDLSEESVTEIDERKGEIESCERDLAIDSSSVAAAECVSRSESLLRQRRTRCLKSRDEDEDIVEVLRRMEVFHGGGLSVNSGSIAGD